MAELHVFVGHAVEDKKSKDHLLSHLTSQQEDGKASFWDRDLIVAGTEEALVIKNELEQSDIVLLLLSADFFNSNYCLAVEKKAYELVNTSDVTVVPVMIRHFDLASRYDSKTTIPDRATPILGSHWNSKDEAFHNVAEIIGDIIDDKIAGRSSPHLKPPSLIRKSIRKLSRPIGIFLYIFLLVIFFSLLFLPKRNLPVAIKLEVNQVSFRLIKQEGNGLWSEPLLAKVAKVKNFNTARIPGSGIRFLEGTDELFDIPDSGITINRKSTSVETYLYLYNAYLSKWDIADSSNIELRMAPGKSFFVGVENGKSNGAFNFNDSLELNTESSILKLGNTEFEDDLEAIVYSSLGRVNFEFDRFGHSISLDSLEKSIGATHLYVTELRFEKDLRDENGTLLSSVLSGTITFDAMDPIAIDTPETDFLKLESTSPLIIQKISVLDDSIELFIRSDHMHDIQRGTSLTSMESEMPTILDWLTIKYKLELLASIFVFLVLFIILLKNLSTKNVHK